MNVSRQPTVLVIDDEYAEAYAVVTALARRGCEGLIAQNMEEAHICRARHEFDAVIIDCSMPETDGLTALRKWVTRYRNDRVVLLGTIEELRPIVKKSATELGAQGFLTKPLYARELRRVLDEVIGDIKPSSVPSESRATGYRILVIDDDDAVREALCKALERKGHHLVEARNGREALAMVSENAFEVMILDIAMPEMDGIEVMRHMRTNFPDAVVIVVTGMYDPGGYIAATVRALGASSVLNKPVRMEEIEHTMQSAFAARAQKARPCTADARNTADRRR